MDGPFTDRLGVYPKIEGEEEMYVIQRVTDGAYVAPSGSPSSYVRALQAARVFGSREAAERELCVENERIVTVDSQLAGRNA